eukprot:85156-Prymnesium_polylepis.1
MTPTRARTSLSVGLRRTHSAVRVAPLIPDQVAINQSTRRFPELQNTPLHRTAGVMLRCAIHRWRGGCCLPAGGSSRTRAPAGPSGRGGPTAAVTWAVRAHREREPLQPLHTVRTRPAIVPEFVRSASSHHHPRELVDGLHDARRLAAHAPHAALRTRPLVCARPLKCGEGACDPKLVARAAVKVARVCAHARHRDAWALAPRATCKACRASQACGACGACGACWCAE